MKKTILGIAFMAVAMFGFSASAQKNDKDCCKDKACKEQKAEGKSCDKAKGDCFSSKVFEGITLTENQKNQFKKLQEEGKANREKYAAQAKKDRSASDSLRKEARKKAKEGRLAAKKERLAGIKKILTPEQYVLFLENTVIYGQDRMGGKGMKVHKVHKPHKAHKANKAHKDFKKEGKMKSAPADRSKKSERK